MTPLSPEGVLNTYDWPKGIYGNNIVGMYPSEASDGFARRALWSGGSVYTLGGLGPHNNMSHAYCVNGNNVVGGAGDGTNDAIIWWNPINNHRTIPISVPRWCPNSAAVLSEKGFSP